MIIRVEKNKDNPYVIKSKIADNDPHLSWKAKGIHSFLMGLPDNWELNIEHLKKVSTDAKDSTAAGVKELVNAGYIKRERERTDGGKFGGIKYIVYEVPQLFLRKPQKQIKKPKTAFPSTENPKMVKPKLDNPSLINKDSNNKEHIVNKEANKASESKKLLKKHTNKQQPLIDVAMGIINEIRSEKQA